MSDKKPSREKVQKRAKEFVDAVDIYERRAARYVRKTDEVEEEISRLIGQLEEEYENLQSAHHELEMTVTEIRDLFPDALLTEPHGRLEVQRRLGFESPVLVELLWGESFPVLGERPDVPELTVPTNVPEVFRSTRDLAEVLLVALDPEEEELQDLDAQTDASPPPPPATPSAPSAMPIDEHPLAGAIAAARLLLEALERAARS